MDINEIRDKKMEMENEIREFLTKKFSMFKHTTGEEISELSVLVLSERITQYISIVDAKEVLSVEAKINI